MLLQFQQLYKKRWDKGMSGYQIQFKRTWETIEELYPEFIEKIKKIESEKTNTNGEESE